MLLLMKEGKKMEPRRNSHRRSKPIKPTKRRPHPRTSAKRKLNKKKVAVTLAIFILLIISIVKAFSRDETVETSSNEENKQVSTTNEVVENQSQQDNIEHQEPKPKKEITEWNLCLANYENILPEDFEIELANIDDTKQFDARAIKYLNKMMNDIRKDGIANIWVQSAYRSVERQKELYNNSVQKYLKQGKTQEEAERLTDEYINKPGASDHNLGLAVDFNNVDNNFEDLKAFKWLQENAENYGFILRYPKHKEDITKIAYESWHWRYVGEEHAKKMNELDMCLEEYIEYLQNEDSE